MITYLSCCSVARATAPVGSRGSTWHGVVTFVTERFPAALYRLRWWWIGTTLGNVAGRPP